MILMGQTGSKVIELWKTGLWAQELQEDVDKDYKIIKWKTEILQRPLYLHPQE